MSRLPTIPWYYFTRALGAVMVVYGMFFDETGERGTIIAIGSGFIGYDLVKRSDESKPGG